MIIENLSKVTVETEINPSAAVGKGDDAVHRFEFIFGIASPGLSSFEQQLYNKSVADVVSVSVPKTLAAEYFGHIYQHLRQLFGSSAEPDVLDLRFTVVSVQQSQGKEIIKAMSRSLAHSCGGSGCDCGCS